MKTARTARFSWLASLILVCVVAASLATEREAGAAVPSPFSGDRNIVLAPKNSEGILGIDRDLRATYAEAQGPRNRFVLIGSGDRYLVKTARITRGGEPLCLQLGRRDVFVTACDAAARHQLFSFRPASPSNGNQTWTIRTSARRYLVQNRLGGFEPAVIAEGTPDIDTPFLLVDKGASNLPALD